MDDGFSMDLSGANYAFQYKPDFVSPLAARFAPGIAKADYVSPLDTDDSRFMQGRTAAALAGCGSCSGLGQYSRTMAYKPGNVSPIAYRMAPRSLKPDFVSPLEPAGYGSTRFMQNRTAAALAGTHGGKQSRYDSLPESTKEALRNNQAGNSSEISEDPILPIPEKPPFWLNPDGTYKKSVLIGGAAAVGLAAYIAMR